MSGKVSGTEPRGNSGGSPSCAAHIYGRCDGSTEEDRSLPLKYVTKFEYGDALAQDVRGEGTTPVFGSNGVVGSHDVANTLAPSIIIGRKGSFGKVTWADMPAFCIDTAYYIDKRHTKANLRWLYWMLQTLGLDMFSEDTGVPGLSREKAYRVHVPYSPLPEQTRIANFLDEQTARIDALIAEKERLDALLGEYRGSLISAAVMGQLGLLVEGSPQKNAVEPVHVVSTDGPKEVPLKRLINAIASGVSVNAVDRPAEKGEIGVLKTSCVYSGTFDCRENKAVVSEELHRVACPVKANTIIVSRMNTPDLVGAAGLCEDDEPNLYLPDRLWQVTLDNRKASPAFVYWWTCSRLYRDQVKVACEGTSSSMQNLDQASFADFSIPVHALTVQNRIANFLDEKTARIDDLRSHCREHIARLREYRSSLISAAVTGQLDIDNFGRGAA